nr:hypothetical protein PZA16_17045 [Klebsiella pneumoniae]
MLENEKRASELEKAIEAINLEYIDREQAFQNKIDAITALIAAQRKQFSLWRKFIHLWVKTNEQKEKEAQLALKQSLEHEKSEALEFLQAKKGSAILTPPPCDSYNLCKRASWRNYLGWPMEKLSIPACQISRWTLPCILSK